MVGLIIIIAIALLIFTMFSRLVTGAVRLFVVCLLAILLFGFGFLWLPSKLDALSSGQMTFSELISEVFTFETIKESVAETEKYWEENKEDILDSAKDIKEGVKEEIEKSKNEN